MPINKILFADRHLFIYARSDIINNRDDRIKETRQEYPKQSLYPTIRQPQPSFLDIIYLQVVDLQRLKLYFGGLATATTSNHQKGLI